ncbi:16S rRNA (adenine(1518)-N(6)/adenine(1519)-N(6))-dimethyltransferase RsmA [Aquirufa ecclesiirivi]|uniref:16S rRNA (adenine(1518)-N(6)/adenine(1519)-N(6))- dimethyltransferase RsmA n=1 Tax=Aquirufa ecclesiirivi TaxID=2715124 RepID=UPI00140811BB|nr:16S rRNA (adenine(1518)-N(6)/adenine(1519)-N(6))-dimethyltransferase RsmA [Aquirufa ecclesiirivi]MCZ2472874.1 16S rRNA (adenine(1518)-N(6)/adenine(1519)-N(6))-dimethyltransferase RsmA [Aquirufa ecclesiirivi]NHC49613.1 16S rRNA (adenine(1518)-N(6)/adenine(1519)-N(6))-dimethyltransferase RsmA [Aquirufa ecclesiirivi]
MQVRAKKSLGQHFLKDLDAAQRIVNGLNPQGAYQKVLEIGPGMGVLTQYLVKKKEYETYLIEIDQESVAYLRKNYLEFTGPRLIDGDFLRYPLENIFGDEKFAVVGNFPYFISTQIFFRILEYKDQCVEVVGMLQKEVAERLAAKPGNKDYGILSVLLQAYFDVEYLFTLGPEVFTPPPKVNSGVIRVVRNWDKKLECDPQKFKQVVKMAFNQRRKTLRNALRAMQLPDHPLLSKRAEQLGVAEFSELTELWKANGYVGA